MPALRPVPLSPVLTHGDLPPAVLDPKQMLSYVSRVR
jgi:hypothetical protein